MLSNFYYILRYAEFSSITDNARNDVYRCISGIVSRIEGIPPSDRDMSSAVRDCERKHPLGEGM
ncbi:MAG: hypothetical protein ISR54_03290 [Chlorobium phaeobacteroides]|uniref:Uncharacterized protein n=1 Tax=Chlorobium phaeobacteroides (strain BS1) TaxID=331678 RepID=B3EPJ5_CHLPB|nr:hypothetical protein [Chlorobium phaeobacteroides]MBL6955836.1 hypothetical protein [Chlorobium phaeobacteroides]NEX14024.1 hypothetical protein [Prosthecochloris sp.]